MADSSLTNILSLIQAFTGKESEEKRSGSTTTTSGGTNTTTTSKKTEVSQDAMNSMLKSALEGTQGLAAISAGQNAAGLYNSSTNTMLTNDLLSRLAAQTASANSTVTQTATETTSPKTVVQTPSTATTSVPGLASNKGTMGALAAASLFKPQLDKVLKSKGGLAGLLGLFGGVDESAGTASAITPNIADALSSNTTTLEGVLAASARAPIEPIAESVASIEAPDVADSSFNIFSDWFSDNAPDVAETVAETVASSTEDSGLIDTVGNFFKNMFSGW